MSVQTQINRISGAVSAALTALAEKGVTVPAGTKVDGLAALIAAIESGGGGSVVRGTWVQASDGYYHTVTHDLGKVPEVAVIWETNGASLIKSQCLIGIQLPEKAFGMRSTGTGATRPYGQYYLTPGSIESSHGSPSVIFGSANITTITFSNYNTKIIAGSSYEYIIW